MKRGDRFREAAKAWVNAQQGRSVIELCSLVGITEQTYYGWIRSNDFNASAENLMKFALLTRYHPTWLWNGKGEKLLADDQRVSGLLDEIHTLHDDDYQEALRYLRLLKAARSAKTQD